MPNINEIRLFNEEFEVFGKRPVYNYIANEECASNYNYVWQTISPIANNLASLLSDEEFIDLSNRFSSYNKIVESFKRNSNRSKAEAEFINNLRELYQQVFNLLPRLISKLTDKNTNLAMSFAETKTLFDNERLRQREINEMQNERLRKEIKELETRLVNTLNKTGEDAKHIEGLRDKLEGEWNEFRENYKGLFAQGEIYKQSNDFKQNSESYANQANNWRYYIGGILLLLFGACIWFLYSCWNGMQCLTQYNSIADKYFTILFYAKIFSIILLKFFIISIVVYVLKFAINNYNALMHNSTINAHKHSSLFSALRIFEIIKDPTLQQQFLSDTGKEIFTQRKTGYLRKEEDNLNFNLLKEILKVLKKD